MNFLAGLLGSLIGAMLANIIGGIIVAAIGRTPRRFLVAYVVVLLVTLLGTAWLRTLSDMPAISDSLSLPLIYAAGLLVDALVLRSLFRLVDRWRASNAV